MIEAMAIEAVRAAGPAAASAAPAAASGSPAAGATAAERFAAAMAAPPPETVPFAGEVSEAFAQAQSGYQTMLHRVNALAELSARGSLSAGQLSALQYDVASLSFQQEVLSSVAKKASDAVSTLVRNG